MRILFATYSERTHFFSMVPLAWALRTAGHEVRVASQPALESAVTGAGLTMVPVGRDHVVWDFLNRRPEYSAQIRSGQRAPYDAGDLPEEEITWDYLLESYRHIVPWSFRLANDPMVNDLIEYCRWWRPDLVVWEPNTFAGAIAAEACGAVHARLPWGLDFDGRLREQFVRLRDQVPGREDPLRDWMAQRLAPLGIEFQEHMAQGHFTVDQFPEPFRVPTGLEYLGVRYVSYNGPSTVPDWLRVPPERPRVALTLGLSAVTNLSDYPVPVGDILLELGKLDAEVVATVAAEQQSELPELPENVRLVEFAPMNDLLPTCSAMINHGGFGSTNTAITLGVPQLLLAEQHDAPTRAEYLHRRGSGIFLPVAERSAKNIAAATQRLLTEESFVRGAEEVREEMAAMPSPNDVVPEVERLVEKYRTRR